MIPTDKTNSFRTMDIHKYIAQMLAHLQANGKKIPRSRLTEVHQEAQELLEDKRHLMSDQEAHYLQKSIDSKAIPTPKLLIKDHKKPNQAGDFPTRLVIPANNFTAGIPHMGYLAIKRIFDDNKIPYMRNTIIQSSDLKAKLESLHLTQPNTTIVSIDAVNFYPSVKFKLIKESVYHFSQGLATKDKAIINHGLEMIQFGMRSTLLTFQDQYFEYDATDNPEEKGLAIGSYESAWLADLAGAYILDTTQECFQDTSFHGLYRDDGFAVFKSTMTYDDMTKWMQNFQAKVNSITGGDYLQFTCSMWTPGSTSVACVAAPP